MLGMLQETSHEPFKPMFTNPAAGDLHSYREDQSATSTPAEKFLQMSLTGWEVREKDSMWDAG